MLCTITIPDDYPIDILIISSLSSFKKFLIRILFRKVLPVVFITMAWTLVGGQFLTPASRAVVLLCLVDLFM